MINSLRDLRGAKLLLYFSFVILTYNVVYSKHSTHVNLTSVISPKNMKKHQHIVNKYYEARKNWVTSNLGEYLFKNTNEQPESYAHIRKQGRSFFYVLLWTHWPWLMNRHVNSFGQHEYDPLSECSVTNCKFTGNDNPKDIESADAVVVHLLSGSLPQFPRRDQNQLWIFWTDESPYNTFSLAHKRPSFVQLSNLFNWSMTYRSDSDIPVPYGRTLPLPYPKLNNITNRGLKQLIPFWKDKRRDVLAANVMSRCPQFRMQFIKRLQRFISVDTFGRCSTVEHNKRRCPGHFRADCPLISEYLFYVVIENSCCRQYITEKVFHHCYAKGAIPIIAGAPLEDCIKLLPPNSFIHVDNFSSLNALAKEVYLITKNISRLLSYHAWRNNFEIHEEHGFLGTRSFVLCRLCEGLNYNDMERKQYSTDDIRLYLDRKVCCRSTLRI